VPVVISAAASTGAILAGAMGRGKRATGRRL
jgi:hypothetical protein